jgi:haloalkane dehalogenase
MVIERPPVYGAVIPELSGLGRVIAPDLMGQGDSEKLPASEWPDRYSFTVVYDYLNGLLEAIGANQNITLVIHNWGSALGFYWAQQYPDAVRGIAYMEGIVCPLSWDDWPESARGIFKGFRSDKGE